MINGKEYQRQYRIKNRERLAAYKKAWDEQNKEKVQKNSRERYIAKKEQIKKYTSEWKKSNPAKVIANTTKRKKHIRLRTPNWLTPIDFERIQTQYQLAVLLTKITDSPWEVDHDIPLLGKNVSGLHVPSNLRVIPKQDNLAKSNRFEVIECRYKNYNFVRA